LASFLKALGACAAALLIAGAGAAQEGPPDADDRLVGTLKRIKDGGVVRLGHRLNSPPFSYLDARGQPVGYSLDLCLALVEDIADELGAEELRVEFRPVTPENRFAMVARGEVDLECGSTTDNLERRKQVAFSPAIFVTGTKLLVRKDGPVRSVLDLKGRPVAVTRGTSNAAALEVLSQRRGLALTLIAGDEHADSFGLLADGKVDALANDEVLLYGLLAETRSAAQYRVVGDFLSYEPYGLMFGSGDPAFARTVERGFRRLAASREIVWIYDKWFLKRLPSGLRLGLPMSPQLEESFRLLGLPS
jgi:glutamate/aspartate transport system substrate-binding protein